MLNSAPEARDADLLLVKLHPTTPLLEAACFHNNLRPCPELAMPTAPRSPNDPQGPKGAARTSTVAPVAPWWLVTLAASLRWYHLFK